MLPKKKGINRMQYYVYFLTNKHNTVLYVGVTNNLYRRLSEHKQELVEGFTKRYHVHKLIYFETTTDVTAAIEREKQIKSWSRMRKEQLIATANPTYLRTNRYRKHSTPAAGHSVHAARQPLHDAKTDGAH